LNENKYITLEEKILGVEKGPMYLERNTS